MSWVLVIELLYGMKSLLKAPMQCLNMLKNGLEWVARSFNLCSTSNTGQGAQYAHASLSGYLISYCLCGSVQIVFPIFETSHHRQSISMKRPNVVCCSLQLGERVGGGPFHSTVTRTRINVSPALTLSALGIALAVCKQFGSVVQACACGGHQLCAGVA